MKKYIPEEKKLAIILELLAELGCTLYEVEYDTGMLHLTAYVECDEADEDDDDDDECCTGLDEDEDDEEACPDFEADRIGRCIHLCPECGKCMMED